MNERCSGGGKGFGPRKVAFGGHRPVYIGKDLVDEPLSAGRAGFRGIDIGRRAPFVVDEPGAVGAGGEPFGEGQEKLAGARDAVVPADRTVHTGWVGGRGI